MQFTSPVPGVYIFYCSLNKKKKKKKIEHIAALVISRVPHMNPGDDQNSYASNSSLQKSGILRTKHILDGALEDLCNNLSPQCLKIADLGCSSGSNTLVFISNVIATIGQFSQLYKHICVPQVQMFLNDLPENDFNNLFRLLPSFHEKLQHQQNFKPIQCFVCAVPGSFYGRLFPSKSLHFIHSSYSVHWLSKVPEGLENNNKGNVYISKTSPPHVIDAYYRQYRRDFSTFLRFRAEEITPGGKIVLIIVCRDVADYAVRDDCFQVTMVSKSLLDLATEGLVKEADIDSFNIPIYIPHEEEVKRAVDSEGSFEINRVEVFEVSWDAIDDSDEYDKDMFDAYKGARNAAGCVRAIMEPMLVSHFGSSIMGRFFERYIENMSEKLTMQRSHYSMAISLSRK